MKTVYLTLVMFIYFSSSAIADTVMSCNSKKKESILLTQAPTGATRIGKHTLEVKHLKGAKRFTDKKNNDGIFDTHWKYCGYYENIRAHFIYEDGDVPGAGFGGYILYEDSGKLKFAGDEVYFSDDKQRYLISTQQDGAEGPDWVLFDMSGKKLWKGNTYLSVASLNGSNERSYAYVNAPKFIDNHTLTATIDCSGGRSNKRVVTLKKISGQWQWQPEIIC